MKRLRKILLQPLPALALILMVSVSLRVGPGFGPVLATTGTEASPRAETGGLEVCGLPELELMYQTIRSERVELDERLAAASAREGDLAEADTLLRESFEELKLMQEELTAERSEFEEERRQVRKEAEQDLDRLVLVYEAMKPKDAAALFETMSPEFAAGFLGRMQPEVAGDILSAVSSEFAYAVSVMIAARNVQPKASKTPAQGD